MNSAIHQERSIPKSLTRYVSASTNNSGGFLYYSPHWHCCLQAMFLRLFRLFPKNDPIECSRAKMGTMDKVLDREDTSFW